MRCTACYSLTAAFCTLLSPAALAQTQQASVGASPQGTGSQAESITVETGRTHLSAAGGELQRHHEARAIQSVSPDYIAKQAPTQNVVNLLQMQPSANVSAVDPTGINGSTVMIRGLTISDLGFLLDGAPALAPAAGSAQAQLIDTENMEEVAIAPGSSDTSDPVTQAAAGTLYIKMRDPTLRPGGQVDFTYGSFNTYRGFLRLDTGNIGNSGVRGFVSYSNASVDNWRGPGVNKRRHIDGKIIKEWGDGNSVALEQEYNADTRVNFLYPTLAQWQQYKWINTDATYHGISDTTYYKLNAYPIAQNLTVLAPIHLNLGRGLRIDDVPYFLWTSSFATGATVLTQGNSYLGNAAASVNLAQGMSGVVAKNGEKFLVDSGARGSTFIGGNNLKVSWAYRNNTAYAGYWYENYFLPHTDPVGLVNQQDGQPYNLFKTSNYYTLSNGQKYYYTHYNLLYQLNGLYVGDDLSLLHDRLHLSVGFKDVMLDRTVQNYIPGAIAHFGINENIPLPSVGARYDFDKHNEIYVAAEGDYRQPFLGTSISAFRITNGTLSTGSDTPKSEYAIKEEIGYRYNGDRIIASTSFYNINMTNRLLTLNTYQNGVQVAETLDAGGQTSRGVDAQIGTVPLWRCFTPYLTFAYLDARQDNNIATTSSRGAVDYLPTAGRTQIQSPHFQGGIGLSYDDRHFFASLNVKYVSSQYATLMNDEKMPGYVTNDIALGYRFRHVGLVKDPTIRLNLDNLNGSTQRVGVFSYSNNAHATKGVFGGTINGTAPTYYVEPGFAAIVTLSSGF